jgi:predicted Zn-dependent peptidase
LLLGEMDKLKQGQFADDLLTSIIANEKLNYYRSLDSNEKRASRMVNAFINHQTWEQVVKRIDRLSSITKQQLVDFARRHFTNNYVCVYKEEGVDSTQKKIEKPQITPIPANREYQSDFVKNIVNSKVEPIQPRFVNFKTELTDTKTTKGLPLYYKQNTEDGLFNLSFNYEFGDEDDLNMSYAAQYLDYIGTNDMTAAEVQKAFYKLACDFGVSVNGSTTTVSLSGLAENMPQALQLLQKLLNNAKADADSYKKFVNIVLKGREDNKKDQRANYSALCSYGLYGSYNAYTNILSKSELEQMNPQQLVDQLKRLKEMQQTVLYYGPMTLKELNDCLAKNYKTPKRLAPVPVGKEYTEQPTPQQNEIIIAPYDAKNIYMRMFNVGNTQWTIDQMAVKDLFNNYFGGGMNTVVFQELRETRGLAYNAYASYNDFPRKGHPEYYFTHIISQNDKLMDCIHVFNQILDTIPESQPAFDIAKQSLTKSIQAMRWTKYNVLTSYLNAKRHGIDYSIWERIYRDLPSLTLKDIMRFEQQNMAHKTYRYVILGDEKNLDMNALGKIGTIKRVSTEEIFGEK